MNTRFCPFVSNKEEQSDCKHNCYFYDFEKYCCKLESKKKITVSDGCKIAFGFILLNLMIIIIGLVVISLFNLIKNIETEEDNCDHYTITSEGFKICN